MDYRLGIIDEDLKQQAKIRRTIKTNTPGDKDVPEFKEYIKSKEEITSLKPILNEIESDISDHLIDGLIIDYKLVRQSTDLFGSDIYKHLNENVSKLPVILLTNFPDPCHALPYVDSDKIYSKSDFFKIESDFSKEKVRDIIENISKYSVNRSNLQQRFENEMNKFKQDSNNFELYSSLISMENELEQYAPQDSSSSLGILNIERLQKAIQLIDEAYDIVGKRNEQGI